MTKNRRKTEKLNKRLGICRRRKAVRKRGRKIRRKTV
jgi:hypothetical protein